MRTDTAFDHSTTEDDQSSLADVNPSDTDALEQHADGPRVDRLLRRIAARGLSGRLRYQRRDNEAAFAFENGRLTEAWAAQGQQLLGELLLAESAVDRGTLRRALDLQQRQPGRRLGEILLEMGAIEGTDLRSALLHQAARIVDDLRRNEGDGILSFQRVRPAGKSDISLSMSEVLLDRSLRRRKKSPSGPRVGSHSDAQTAITLPEPVVMDTDSSRVLYENVADTAGHQVIAAATPSPNANFLAADALRRVADAASSGAPVAELFDRLMQSALTFVERVALLEVTENGLILRDARCRPGLEAPFLVHNRRAASISPRDGGLIARALERSRAMVSVLSPATLEDELVAVLGGGAPHSGFCQTLRVNGIVRWVLYGDRLDERPIQSFDTLETAVLITALANDRDRLQRRVRALEADVDVLARACRDNSVEHETLEGSEATTGVHQVLPGGGVQRLS